MGWFSQVEVALMGWWKPTVSEEMQEQLLINNVMIMNDSLYIRWR